jgi:hypothetical protein
MMTTTTQQPEEPHLAAPCVEAGTGQAPHQAARFADVTRKEGRMSDEYIPGVGCTCSAWNESECGCDGVDWTPKEVYELREKCSNLDDQLSSAMMVIRGLERERDEWKAKYIQQNKDLGCEMMDPAGTIWDYASGLQRENAQLKREIENLKASGIHTCHDQCQRPMCVMRRERDEAVNNYETAVLREHRMQEQRDRLAAIARELTAMIRVNVMWGRFTECSVEQIDEHLKPWNEKIAAVKGGSDE